MHTIKIDKEEKAVKSTIPFFALVEKPKQKSVFWTSWTGHL